MPTWLTGRKAKLFYAAVLGALAGVLTGEMTWTQFIVAAMAAACVLMTGIAIEDAGAKAGRRLP